MVYVQRRTPSGLEKVVQQLVIFRPNAEFLFNLLVGEDLKYEDTMKLTAGFKRKM